MVFESKHQGGSWLETICQCGLNSLAGTLALLRWALTFSVVCFIWTLSTTSHADTSVHKSSPYHPEKITTRASEYYQSLWGIDNLLVRRTASGSLIRFSFRVVDPKRAGVLTDDRDMPHMIDPERNVALQIPKLEQVGEMRQRGEPVANMEYWMVFSNKGDPVKVGDRVNVIIGSFHGDGLLVE